MPERGGKYGLNVIMWLIKVMNSNLECKTNIYSLLPYGEIRLKQG